MRRPVKQRNFRALSLRPLLIDAGRYLALLGGALAAVLLALMPMVGLSWHGITLALVAYGVIAIFILVGIGYHSPHRRFGPANAITLVRAAYTTLLIGTLSDGAPLDESVRWMVVISGLAALALDGVDGWAARRYGLNSAFGARFDMEIDALFVLALSALAWRSDRAGSWVLAIGLMRYGFVLANWLWPFLAAPLPPSQRRKTVCVIVILALLVALAPPVADSLASLICVAGLALLSYSFGADCLYLIAAAGKAKAVETGIVPLPRSE
jgi:phosphatidylglycerophosphate synthase